MELDVAGQSNYRRQETKFVGLIDSKMQGPDCKVCIPIYFEIKTVVMAGF